MTRKQHIAITPSLRLKVARMVGEYPTNQRALTLRAIMRCYDKTIGDGRSAFGVGLLIYRESRDNPGSELMRKGNLMYAVIRRELNRRKRERGVSKTPTVKEVIAASIPKTPNIIVFDPRPKASTKREELKQLLQEHVISIDEYLSAMGVE